MNAALPLSFFAVMPAYASPVIEPSAAFSVPEVCALLDVPEWAVDRWCRAGLLPGAKHRKGSGWIIPGRALSFFCGRSIEPLYSPETVAGILDVSVETVREYLAAGRLEKVKLGSAKSAPVRIRESTLRRWMAA